MEDARDAAWIGVGGLNETDLGAVAELATAAAIDSATVLRTGGVGVD